MRCTQCTREVEDPKYKQCTHCREYHRIKGQQYREARPEFYRERSREQKRKDLEQRRGLGFCTVQGCRVPPVPGETKCVRHRALARRNVARRKYGISDEVLDALLAQEHCAICGSTKNLCIDHHHESGKVRERLCQQCNKGLGNFKEDQERLTRAIEYLRRHHGSTVPEHPGRVEATPAVGDLAVHPARGTGDEATLQCQDWYPGIFD